MLVKLRKRLKKSLKLRTKYTGAQLFKKKIKPVITNARRTTKKFKKKYGVTYGGIRRHDYLKKLIIKNYGD